MEAKVEVKTVWREMVKPLHSTPSHLKTLKLSFPDQNARSIYVPTILFYSMTSLKPSFDQHVLNMKISLSEALSEFYPLAGRVVDESTLLCNDKGVPLIYTQVNCSLSSYLPMIIDSINNNNNNNSSSDHSHDSSSPLIRKLLPPLASLSDGDDQSESPSHMQEHNSISALVQLAIQVNIFQGGGAVIGCYMNHKLMDASSLATFLSNWAGLGMSEETRDQIAQPNFDAIVAAFPHYPSLPNSTNRNNNKTISKELLEKVLLTGQGAGQPDYSSCSIVAKAFVFKPASISALRERASGGDRAPNPTRFEAVMGFLWMHALEAEAKVWSESALPTSTSVVISVDVRPRARPPLPREAMGNLANYVVARVGKKKGGLGPKDMVAEIRGAINEFKDEKLVEFQGEKGAEALF